MDGVYGKSDHAESRLCEQGRSVFAERDSGQMPEGCIKNEVINAKNVRVPFNIVKE